MPSTAIFAIFIMTSLGWLACKPASERPPESPSASPAPGSEIERLVLYVIQRYQPATQTGVAIAAVKNGVVVLNKTYGWRDRSNKLPVTENTVFAIGSLTKAFTAFVITQLNVEGKLNLPDPVRRYYPSFSIQDPGASAQMNLTDMLSHRSGLPAHDVAWSFTSMGRGELMSRLRYFEMDRRPQAGFRSGFYYNNMIYTAAGVAAARVTGQSWEDLVRERVLTPLSMGSCVFDAQLFSAADFARPYLYEEETRYINPQAIGPAGSLDCSLRDMVVWLKLHLNRGRTEGGQQVLSEANMESMYTPQTAVDQSSGVYYGFGWYVARDARTGSRTISHPGTFGAYLSGMAFNPELGFGAVVMCNQELGEMLRVQLLGVLDDYFKGRPYGEIVAALPAAPSFVPPDLSAHRPMTSGLNEGHLVSRYRHPGYGDIAFYAFNGQTIAKYGESYMLVTADTEKTVKMWMRAVGDYVPVILTFSADATSFSVVLNLEPVASVFTKVG
jgi:CubicO group peptidase (beta-lactamase class C family)